MTEVFIEKPHLPIGKVSQIILSEEIPGEISQALASRGVKVHLLGKDKYLPSSISSHPDINVFHCGLDRFIVTQTAISALSQIGANIEIASYDKNDLSYPKDAFLDNLLLSEHLFCGRGVANEVLSYAIGNNISVEYLKQGYVKCSTCIVNEHAIITEDKNIASTLAKHNIDVLLLESKEIMLKGYNCGFIGGASFKLSSSELAFYGNIEQHSEYVKIKRFCENHGIECISLAQSALMDFGGAVLIKEWI